MNAMGSTWRVVVCEHCRTQFAYLLTRAGVATEPVFLGNEGEHAATSSAQLSAVADLERQLEFDNDVVACPGCRMYQSPMLKVARRDKTRGFGIIAALLAAVAVLLWLAHHRTVALAASAAWLAFIANWVRVSDRYAPAVEPTPRALNTVITRAQFDDARAAGREMPDIEWASRD